MIIHPVVIPACREFFFLQGKILCPATRRTGQAGMTELKRHKSDDCLLRLG
jgi:hypothetical protein